MAKQRRPGRKIVAVLAALLVATGVGYAWLVVSAPDEPSTRSGQEPAVPSSPDIEPEEVSSPLVVPIDGASDVVADINDNASESEALEMLGLDEAGNVVAPGYRFTWSSDTGDTATVTVDATTGDYSFESSDGLEWRSLDGTSYARDSTLEWSEVDADALASTQRLGLDGPITIDELIDPITAEYSSSVTNQRGDGTSSLYVEINSAAYAAGHPDVRTQWLALMGLPNPDQEVEPGAIIIVDASVGTDGRTLESFTVATMAHETSYTLDEVFDSAPVIDTPEL